MSGTDSPFASLDGYDYLSLTPFRRTGQAVPTPVWFARQGNKVYITTRTGAGKAKRIAHTARVEVAPCDVRSGLLGAVFPASARILTDSPDRELAKKALAAKYGRLDMWRQVDAAPDESRVYLEISAG